MKQTHHKNIENSCTYWFLASYQISLDKELVAIVERAYFASIALRPLHTPPTENSIMNFTYTSRYSRQPDGYMPSDSAACAVSLYENNTAIFKECCARSGSAVAFYRRRSDPEDESTGCSLYCNISTPNFK